MRRTIRMGEGKIEISYGHQDGLPVLIFAPHKEGKYIPVGHKTGKAGSQVSVDELNERDAVVLEFPEYKGIDVLLYEIMALWEDSKEAEWDKNSKVSTEQGE